MAARTMRITLTGPDVRALQIQLASLGLMPERNVDGIFGPGTARAVLAFQKAHGLPEDGVVGPMTACELELASTHASVAIDATLTPHRDETHAADDPGGPYLFFDVYPLDLDDPRTKEVEIPPFEKVAARPHFCGGMLKATDGLGWGYESWFRDAFAALKKAGGDRYGSTWFRGAYHFLQFAADGRAQADYYLRVMREAGCTWSEGDMMPIVDVELGGERAANRRATAAQIVKCTSDFAARVKAVTGRRCMLYGRGAMRDLAIASKMGCDRVWDPSYTAEIATNGLVRVDDKPGPWTLDDIGLWQYGGDGTGDDRVHHLPLEIVGFGKVDVSAHIAGARKPTLDTLRAAIV